MSKGIATIDYQTCMTCGCCLQACPFGFFERVPKNIDSSYRAYPQLVNDHRCTGCGFCVVACPLNCIQLES